METIEKTPLAYSGSSIATAIGISSSVQSGHNDFTHVCPLVQKLVTPLNLYGGKQQRPWRMGTAASTQSEMTALEKWSYLTTVGSTRFNVEMFSTKPPNTR